MTLIVMIGGAPLAALFSGWLESLLYGVSRQDPATIAARTSHRSRRSREEQPEASVIGLVDSCRVDFQCGIQPVRRDSAAAVALRRQRSPGSRLHVLPRRAAVVAWRLPPGLRGLATAGAGSLSDRGVGFIPDTPHRTRSGADGQDHLCHAPVVRNAWRSADPGPHVSRRRERARRRPPQGRAGVRTVAGRIRRIVGCHRPADPDPRPPARGESARWSRPGSRPGSSTCPSRGSTPTSNSSAVSVASCRS